MNRLPLLAAELVNLQVSAILAVTNAAALAAKAATATIPIVFAIGGDPVALGLVSNIEKPGGNLTGISALTAGLDAKRIELLHQLVPNAKTIGILVNRADPASSAQLQEAVSTAGKLGLELESKNASTETEVEISFRRPGKTNRRLVNSKRCFLQQQKQADCRIGGTAFPSHPLFLA